jgi:hypothetical protein
MVSGTIQIGFTRYIDRYFIAASVITGRQVRRDLPTINETCFPAATQTLGLVDLPAHALAGKTPRK